MSGARLIYSQSRSYSSPERINFSVLSQDDSLVSPVTRAWSKFFVRRDVSRALALNYYTPDFSLLSALLRNRGFFEQFNFCVPQRKVTAIFVSSPGNWLLEQQTRNSIAWWTAMPLLIYSIVNVGFIDLKMSSPVCHDLLTFLPFNPKITEAPSTKTVKRTMMDIILRGDRVCSSFLKHQFSCSTVVSRASFFFPVGNARWRHILPRVRDNRTDLWAKMGSYRGYWQRKTLAVLSVSNTRRFVSSMELLGRTLGRLIPSTQRR